MAKHYEYSDAKTSHTGIMVCAACHKPITEGDYRYRETTDRYINWHRKCCADDVAWAKRDKEFARMKASRIAFLAACMKFRDLWDVDDLDEHIKDAAPEEVAAAKALPAPSEELT